MPGTKIVLSAPFTDTTLPVLNTIDRILPSAGALLLVDSMHSVSPTVGAPTPGQLLVNIAAAQAKALIAGATDFDVSAVFKVVSNSDSGAVYERSTKGGIRTRGRYYGVQIPAKVIDYMQGPGNGHAFYVSGWMRKNVAEPTTQLVSHLITQSGGVTAYIMRAGNPGTNLTNSRLPGTAAGAALWTASFTMPSAFGAAGSTGAQILNANGTAAMGTLGVTASATTDRTAYRYYVEDLTVSGRTWAQVDALDAAFFNADVLTSGGRYFGDATVTA